MTTKDSDCGSIQIQCGSNRADFDLNTWLVNFQGKTMTPTDFERRSGRAQSKSWKSSIEVSSAGKSMGPIRAWLEANNHSDPRTHSDMRARSVQGQVKTEPGVRIKRATGSLDYAQLHCGSKRRRKEDTEDSKPITASITLPAIDYTYAGPVEAGALVAFDLSTIKPGEGMVLGQILTGELATAYKLEQKRWVEFCHDQPLVAIHGENLDLTPEEVKIVEGKVILWIEKHLQQPVTSGQGNRKNRRAFVQQWLQDLPADVAVDPRLCRRTIQPDDPRISLQGSLGCFAYDPAMSTDGGAVFEKGDVIGPYRGIAMSTRTFIENKNKPHPNFDGSRQSWKANLDSYGLDLSFDSFTDLPEEGEEGDVRTYDFVASAFTAGNMTALINDPTVDPMNFAPQNKETGNCIIRNFRIGAWCWPLVIAKEDILQGQEVCMTYGQEYWQLFLDHQLEQAAADAERAEIQALKEAVALAAARAEAAEASATQSKDQLKEVTVQKEDQALQMASLQRRFNQQEAEMHAQATRINRLRMSAAMALAEDTTQQTDLENLKSVQQDDAQYQPFSILTPTLASAPSPAMAPAGSMAPGVPWRMIPVHTERMGNA